MAGKRAALRWFGERSAGDASDLADYRLLVSSLFSSPGSIIPGGIAGILTPYLCWRSTGEAVFLILTAVVAAIVSARVAHVVAYRRLSHEEDGLARTRFWDRGYRLGATLFSGVLGVSCYLALTETDDPAAHITSVASTIALASGYVSRNAGRPRFVASQLVIFCVPMALGLIQAHNETYHYIGYFALLYIVANIAITNSIHRNLLALSDATKQSKALASRLRSQNVTLDAALNTMIHGLALYDRDLTLAVANDSHRRIYGLPETLALPGTPIDALSQFLVVHQIVDPGSVEAVRTALCAVQNGSLPILCEVATGTGRTLAITVAPVADGGAMLLTEDATERKATAARIERMARFDELTGLANRFEFNGELAAACARLEQTGEGFALLYIDLDGFKQVNDSLGHDVGDKVLSETARRLRAVTRSGDVLARFGGDEFVVILPHADPSVAAALAGRLIEAMSAQFDSDGRAIFVTASIGIALAPTDGSVPADLLRHADTALYKAKAAGRNTLTFFDPAMAEEMVARLELEMDLRHAVEAGELELFYQPIVDMKTQRIVSREALMRWRHPRRGMVSPGEFIPAAERAGLIGAMGEWAIARACADAAAWEEDIAVSVNVSPLQFREPDRIVEAVKRGLLACGLPSRRLMLEVTESLLIEDNSKTLEVIDELRSLGVAFALDDFGTGYSSLAYLSTYPFSQVKIDQSFTRDVASNEASKAIVEAVCQLARRLSMTVVVEGIETEIQRVTVQLLGAQRAQGYLFGRPAPISTIQPQDRASA